MQPMANGENKKKKYAAHNVIAEKNKLRRIRKHLKKHSNDQVALRAANG